jgi:hypothetical protein
MYFILPLLAFLVFVQGFVPFSVQFSLRYQNPKTIKPQCPFEIIWGVWYKYHGFEAEFQDNLNLNHWTRLGLAQNVKSYNSVSSFWCS